MPLCLSLRVERSFDSVVPSVVKLQEFILREYSIIWKLKIDMEGIFKNLEF